jgi:ABC-type multidrug transport system permease subunit
MHSIVAFVQNNTVIAIVIVVGLLFMIYRKPKLFLGFLFLGLFLAALYYLIMSTAGSGSKQEKRLFIEEEKQLDTGR